MTGRRKWLVLIHAITLSVAIAGYPLIAGLSTLFGLPNTALSIAIRALVSIASVLMIMLSLNIHQRDRLSNAALIFTIIFWSLYLIRMAYETTYFGYELLVSPFNYWVWAIGGSFVPMLGLSRVICVNREGDLHATWMRMIILAAIIVVLPNASTAVDIDTGVAETGRLGLQTLNPISTGHLGVSAMIMALWTVFLRDTRVHWRDVAVSGALFLGGGVLAITANSRGPLVALIIAILFMIFASGSKRKYWLVGVIGFGIASFASLVSALDAYFGTRTFERFFGQSQLDDVTTLARVDIYDTAINQFQDNVLLGSGLEIHGTGGYPHNIVIEAFMTTGLFGGAILLMMLILSLLVAWRVMRRAPAFGWVGLLFVQYIVGAQFSGSIFESTTLWASLGALLGVSIFHTQTSAIVVRSPGSPGGGGPQNPARQGQPVPFRY